MTGPPSQLAGRHLDPRVGGQDGVGGVVESASAPGRAAADRLRDAGLEHRHRQRPADHAGGRDQHLLGRAADVLRGELGHPLGVGEALLAGAGVGVAGADDDGAGVGPREPLPADLHRGGADAVLGEHAGGGGRAVADDHGQVAAVRLGCAGR